MFHELVLESNICLIKVCPHRASASVAAAVSPLEYIVMLGNQFSSITMYSNGDADTSAAADAWCGQTLRADATRSPKQGY